MVYASQTSPKNRTAKLKIATNLNDAGGSKQAGKTGAKNFAGKAHRARAV